LESARTALLNYQPSDAREQGFRARMLALLEARAPLSRHHFEPGHLTASAFVLSPEGDALLLIFHRKLGIWVQPGGHIEPTDADLEAAARREVAEEVGLSLVEPAASIFDVDIHAIPARKDEPAHEHFDVRFCLRAPTRAFVASDEVADARWVASSEIDRLTSDESVLRAARKLFGVEFGAASSGFGTER
jgi:8-oxo-dGTP pyrophosphatase MutT (NUDIX family)